MKFGDLLDVVERPADLAASTEYQLVTVKRNREGVVPRERLRGRDVLTKTQFHVAADDFLMSKRQIIHGACGLVPRALDGAIVSNEYAVLRPNAYLSLEYLRHLTHTSYFQRTTFHSSHGVDVEKMIFKLEKWFEYSLALPPLDEQRRIAAALSAIDAAAARGAGVAAALRGVLDALVEFAHEDGRQVHLGDLLADGPTNGVYKPAHLVGEGALLVGMTALSGQTGVDWARSRRAKVEPPELARYGLRAGDVLVRRVYASVQGVGLPVLVSTAPPEPAVFESNMMRVRVDPERAVPRVVVALMHSRMVRHQVEAAATLAAQASINGQTLRGLRLPLPDLPRQRELARVLDTIDRLLDAEQRAAERLRKARTAVSRTLLDCCP